MGVMTMAQFVGACDEFTFDIVLGHDGDGKTGNRGQHWDCWKAANESEHGRTTARSFMKLGKHLGTYSWIQHLLFHFPTDVAQSGNGDEVEIMDLCVPLT
jgi:hypothetical protein